jgi:hypothetical protein
MATLTCQEVGQKMFIAFYPNLKVGTFTFPLTIESAQSQPAERMGKVNFLVVLLKITFKVYKPLLRKPVEFKDFKHPKKYYIRILGNQ